ncbi:hypothetical protein [uncultured Cytophaga sp.]|uniref:hypothetical protein n=1 Tax=uncultured Cytophaga sp. TaxID=160238 RepID=UPI002638E196|nr:hypothetical protein [uncultured Cytophaga sp.]
MNCGGKEDDPAPATNNGGVGTNQNGGGGTNPNGGGGTNQNGGGGTNPNGGGTTIPPTETTIGGSGSFQVDGVTYIPTKIQSTFIVRGNPFSISLENPNYELQISVGNVEHGDDKISTVAITVSEYINGKFTTIYQSRNDIVTLTGKNLIFSNIKIPRQFGDDTKKEVLISGDITFE